MRLSEMKPGVRYVVTKCAKRGSLKVGDRVYLDDKDMSLINRDARGWLREKDWKNIRIGEVELDDEYYQREIARCYARIAGCERILKENGKAVPEGAFVIDDIGVDG